MVWAAMLCTVASVFLTRWLSSATSSFCCSSLWRRSVMSVKVRMMPSISSSVVR
jgi:hypothetical protein